MYKLIIALAMVGSAIIGLRKANSWFTNEFIDYEEAMPGKFGDGSL